MDATSRRWNWSAYWVCCFVLGGSACFQSLAEDLPLAEVVDVTKLKPRVVAYILDGKPVYKDSLTTEKPACEPGGT